MNKQIKRSIQKAFAKSTRKGKVFKNITSTSNQHVGIHTDTGSLFTKVDIVPLRTASVPRIDRCLLH